MTNDPVKRLAATAIALFVASIIIYAVGIQQIYAQLCKNIGPSIAVSAVALGIFSAGVVAARALIVQSFASWAILVLVSVFLAIMYFAIGVLALPGCSGV